jgi:hypothetical protein
VVDAGLTFASPAVAAIGVGHALGAATTVAVTNLVVWTVE